MRTLCKAVIGLYVVAAIAALAIIPLNSAGMAGEPDPLSGVFAVLLAAPWFWLAGPITSDGSTVWNMTVAGGCMAINALILWGLCRWLTVKTPSPPAG